MSDKRAKRLQKLAGVREFRAAWLLNLMEETNRACDRFWQSTLERRSIEAKRRGGRRFSFGKKA
jgi:hypothetical protein